MCKEEIQCSTQTNERRQRRVDRDLRGWIRDGRIPSGVKRFGGVTLRAIVRERQPDDLRVWTAGVFTQFGCTVVELDFRDASVICRRGGQRDAASGGDIGAARGERDRGRLRVRSGTAGARGDEGGEANQSKPYFLHLLPFALEVSLRGCHLG